MSTSHPIDFIWNGTAMVPSVRYTRLAKDRFEEGKSYTMVPHEDRSSKSHRHYFACVNAAWENLPETKRQRDPDKPEIVIYRTPEHLRKRALIFCGYAKHRDYVCKNADQALMLAAWLETDFEYDIIRVRDNIVQRFTPVSQGVGADGMTKDGFEKSKADVLTWIADLVGVSYEDLTRAGHKADGGQGN